MRAAVPSRSTGKFDPPELVYLHCRVRDIISKANQSAIKLQTHLKAQGWWLSAFVPQLVSVLNEPLRFKCTSYHKKSSKVSNVSTKSECGYRFIIPGKAALPGRAETRCEEPVSTAAKVSLSD